jgi:L-aspartate oxidase
VLLDLTHRGEAFIRQRFPRIYETCLRYGVDIGRGAAPVAPAAHYAMGGVWTDLDGRTTLPGLFAAGEAACTGVHGANRLASNSLLEGLVFGARAGRAMRDSAAGAQPEYRERPSAEQSDNAPRVREIAWQSCGIMRTADGLRRACTELEAMPADGLRDVALLIARAALAREESRGAHFRSDFPEKNPELEKHSRIVGDAPVEFR